MIAESATRCSGSIRLVDPGNEHMCAVLELSYALREANSDVRRVIGNGAREGSYTEKMHKDIARSAGELKAAWDGMKMAASAPGTIPQRKAAFAAMENDYFDNYQAKRQAFYEALAAGETTALTWDAVEGLWPEMGRA